MVSLLKFIFTVQMVLCTGVCGEVFVNTIPEQATLHDRPACSYHGAMKENGIVLLKTEKEVTSPYDCFLKCADHFSTSWRGFDVEVEITKGGTFMETGVTKKEVSSNHVRVKFSHIGQCYGATLYSGENFVNYYTTIATDYSDKASTTFYSIGSYKIGPIMTNLEMCKKSAAKPQGFGPGCNAYSYFPNKKECKLYADQRGMNRRDFVQAKKLEDLAVSGLAYCRYNPPDWYLSLLLSSDGCTLENKDFWGKDIATITNIAHVEDCRAKCIQNSQCEVFTYNSQNKNCYLKQESAILNFADKNDHHSGTKYCSTCYKGAYSIGESTCTLCKAGSYCSGGTSATTCPIGSYCPGLGSTEPTKCKPEKEYCPNEGMSTPETVCPTNLYGKGCESTVKCVLENGRCEENLCYSFSGDGLCTDCDERHSGTICEHNVCKKSALAQSSAITESYNHSPSAFKWELYRAEGLSVTQKKFGGNFNLLVEFTPISYDIDSHQLKLNGVNTGSSNPAQPVCESLESAQFRDLALSSDYAKVGTQYKVCLVGKWKDSATKIPKAWGLPDMSSTFRKTPETCVDYTIKFHSFVKLSVKDVYGTVGVKATVTFHVGNKTFTVVTDVNGDLELDVIQPSISTTATQLIIDDVTRENVNSTVEMVYCPGAFTTCQDNNVAIKDKPSIEIRHLEAQSIRLADKSAIPVKGKVTFPFKTGANCAAPRTVVNVYSVNNGGLLLNVTTDDLTGEFAFGIPFQTKIRLELVNGDHSFVSKNSASQNMLAKAGITIEKPVEDLLFEDTTKRKFNLLTAVTDCKYSLGTFSLEITANNCGPEEKLVYTVDKNEFEVYLPAQELKFGLVDFSGVVQANGESFIDSATILDRFDFLFPAANRDVNLSDADVSKSFIFHTEPQVTTMVTKGSAAGSFQCDNNINFDFAVDAATYIEMEFRFLLPYTGDSKCLLVPEGTSLLIVSNLGMDKDPCDGTQGGCTVYAETVFTGLNNQSVAKRYLFTGEPNVYGEQLGDFVRNVELKLYNKEYLGDRMNTEGQVNVDKVRLLLLGHKALTKDSVVTYFTEDQKENVPLLYLYSPPASEGSYQEVTMTLDFEVARQSYANSAIEFGGGVTAGIKTTFEAKLCVPLNGCMFDVAQGEASLSVGVSAVASKVISYEDTINTQLSSKSITFSTPTGSAGGESADMVLLLGTVSRFITSKLVYWDKDTCMVKIANSTIWDSGSKSLVFYSRTDVGVAIDKLQTTIDSNENKIKDSRLSNVAREQAKRLVALSTLSKKKWIDLVSHWEKDKLQARNNKVDLRSMLSGGTKPSPEVVNRLTFGSGDVTLSTEQSYSKSEVTSYTSYGGSVTVSREDSVEMLLGFGGANVGPTLSRNFEFTTVTDVERSTTDTSSSTMSITTFLTEADGGDETCLDVYRSPHSGTFVFEVCGGFTRCPHLPGTDPREKFELNVIEIPPISLQTDRSRVVLELSTPDMLKDDEIDLVIELDPQTATFPVSFTIGSSPLNQKLEYTLAGKSKVQVFVYFERLDPNLQSVEVQGTVKSACDGSVSRSFKFQAIWDSACPPVIWSGDLADSDATYIISHDKLNLFVSAKNPTGTPWRDTEKIDVDVSLWARLDDSLSDWFKVDKRFLTIPSGTEPGDFLALEDSHGQATVKFTPGESNVFRDSKRYHLQLRTECTQTLKRGRVAIGETRSSLRLGVIDLTGPSLVAYTSTPKVRLPSMGIPIAEMMFDEPIDCTSARLKAIIVAAGRDPISASVFCTSRSEQVNVVLFVNDNDDVAFWSNAQVNLTVEGLMDLYGNLFGSLAVQGRSGRRRLLSGSGSVNMQFAVPKLYEVDASTSNWTLPAIDEQQLVVDSRRSKALSASGVASSFFLPTFVQDPLEFDDTNTSAPTTAPTTTTDENSGKGIGLGLGLGAAFLVLAAAGVAGFLKYKKMQSHVPTNEVVAKVDA